MKAVSYIRAKLTGNTTVSILKFSGFLWLLIFAVSCRTLYSKYPIGEIHAPSSEHREELEGIWQFGGNGICYFKFLDDDRTLRWASVDWDGTDFRVESFNIYLSKNNDNRYFNVEVVDKETGEVEGYELREYLCCGGRMIVVWMANIDVFGRAVEAQTIRGTTMKNDRGELTDVYIEESSENLLSFIQENSDSFWYKAPIVLMKIANEL